mmetsp:Transcript_26661/g.51389  ORF Transcript_26661/g.51389 Transcript_26661/m.51389 type:complete len:530 (-) Transcript_26661:10-1599(-)
MSSYTSDSAIFPANAGFAEMQKSRAVKDDSVVKQLSADYEKLVTGVREVFDSGRTKDLAWRRAQLQSLLKGIRENTEAITAAIGADLGGPKIRAVFDMGSTVGDAEYALANLTSWATPKKVSNDIPVDFQSSYYVRPEPKGVTLNIAPWNFPVNLSFAPLIPAIAAGNCMVIKPSELAPASAEIIERICHQYLDKDCIKVVQGAVAETTALLEQQWDHIFYTGNGVVGRIVMHAAAKYLTPITLELGGKSPVLVDKTANMAAVVNRVFAAKSMNQGQICIAPDYVLIDESRSEEFISAFSKQIRSSNFGEGSKGNPNWGKIINSRHAERLKRLIDTSGGEVVCGGAADVDAASQHVPMTVIKNVKPDSPIMHEEIFGPILPVVPVKSMDDALKMVKDRERPLALYVFSQDKAFQERALTECTSGGAAVNTALEQIANKEAPFGGIGPSGMGSYHGKAGFDEFSHFRTVLYKSGSAATLPPPEKQPPWLYDVALKALVTGFVSPETKQTIKMAGMGALTLGAAVVLKSRL